MDYKIRFAIPDDHNLIYGLKTESVRPYVEKNWGWDEDYQRKDFDGDFSHIKQFNVIEVDGKFAGFVQYYFDYWNTVHLNDFPQDELYHMIDLAYDTVLNSFSKKVRAEILRNSSE